MLVCGLHLMSPVVFHDFGLMFCSHLTDSSCRSGAWYMNMATLVIGVSTNQHLTASRPKKMYTVMISNPDSNAGWPNVGPTSVLSSRRWTNAAPTYIAVWECLPWVHY